MSDECREAFEKEYPAVGSRDSVPFLTRAERAFAWTVWQAAWNRRSGSAGQWRPITQEDAPEPGTRILGIWPDGFIETVEWSAFWGEVDDLPTHWQPLPPPPGAREG